MIPSRYRRATTAALLFLVVPTWLAGCSEPDKQVTRSTSDGTLSVTLEADRNWVYPNHHLPIKVVIESTSGPVAEDTAGEIDLIANNGTVDGGVSATLNYDLAGPDAEGNGAESRFVDWITFRANSSNLASNEQGEIHALLMDVRATIKIRIAAPPESL